MFRSILLFSFYFFSLEIAYSQQSDCNYKGKDADYFNTIKCQSDFEHLKGPPLTEKYGNVESIKVVYHIQSKEIYFANSKSYHYHIDFATEVLGYYGNGATFNQTQYTDNPLRIYVLANLNHYKSSDIYTLDFFAGDEVTDSQAVAIYRKITATTFFGNKISILANSQNLVEMKKRCGKLISTISPDVIYKNQKYQSLTNGTAYGRLRRVSVSEISKFTFDEHDILLLDGLPNEVPVVSGILTSEFQTPLCHISLLCRNRGTPNASSKSAWTNKNLISLEGNLVKYSVMKDGYKMEKADSGEVMRYWHSKSQKKTIKLKCNEEVNTIRNISTVRSSSLEWAGGKSANFGELTRIEVPGKGKLLIPEGAFVIPFYFYMNHIRSNNLSSLVDSIISSQQPDSIVQSMLKDLRHRILISSLDTFLINSIERKISSSGYKKYRFRSSTNAEDIPGFNGAGLYVSKTGIFEDTVKTIEKAIKQVWASLWDERAFAEREYFHIDEHTVAMGILVHRSFETEKVNGVAITKNLYRKDYPGFTVNAQKDEVSVVFPPDSVTCDQFLILNEGLTGEHSANVDYITRSSINGGRPVLKQEQIELLSIYLEAIKNHYYWKTPLGKRSNGYEDFAMDVEFKIDYKTNRLYIKQARLFN